MDIRIKPSIGIRHEWFSRITLRMFAEIHQLTSQLPAAYNRPS